MEVNSIEQERLIKEKLKYYGRFSRREDSKKKRNINNKVFVYRNKRIKKTENEEQNKEKKEKKEKKEEKEIKERNSKMPSMSVMKTLCHYKMYNNLMSDDYKDFLLNSKRLYFNCPTRQKNTLDKIQKYLNRKMEIGNSVNNNNNKTEINNNNKTEINNDNNEINQNKIKEKKFKKEIILTKKKEENENKHNTIKNEDNTKNNKKEKDKILDFDKILFILNNQEPKK